MNGFKTQISELLISKNESDRNQMTSVNGKIKQRRRGANLLIIANSNFALLYNSSSYKHVYFNSNFK